jgi:hypothetical protein
MGTVQNTLGIRDCAIHYHVLYLMHMLAATLGDCSYLNDCRHPGTCKFMHYEVDPVDDIRIRKEQQQAALNPPGQVGTEGTWRIRLGLDIDACWGLMFGGGLVCLDTCWGLMFGGGLVCLGSLILLPA